MKRNFDRRIWFFGDSFMEHNNNWVHELAAKCKAKVNHLGHGGSSVQFLLVDLIRHMRLIRENDVVVIGITSAARFYLNNKHYHSFISLDYYKEDYYKKQEVEAFKDFVVQLYDTVNDNLYKGSIVSHIINVLIPSLKTKKVQYVYTIDESVYVKNEFMGIKPIAPPIPPFFEFFKDFIREYKPNGYIEEEDNYLQILEGKTGNHWVEHIDFRDRFWETYDQHFSVLYD